MVLSKMNSQTSHDMKLDASPFATKSSRCRLGRSPSPVSRNPGCIVPAQVKGGELMVSRRSHVLSVEINDT